MRSLSACSKRLPVSAAWRLRPTLSRCLSFDMVLTVGNCSQLDDCCSSPAPQRNHRRAAAARADTRPAPTFFCCRMQNWKLGSRV